MDNWEQIWKEYKHLLLLVVIGICVYLLYQKHYEYNIPKVFNALPLIGGAAYGLNFLITLTK